MKIVLDNIRSAWNVGAVMRTCDALGAELVLIGYTARPEGNALKLIKKTSIGAEEWVKWHYFEHSVEALESLSSCLHIGLEVNSTSIDVFEFLQDGKKIDKEMCLWFGNEIRGLDEILMKKLDYTVHLPMQGKKESLNVASTVCAAGYLFKFAKLS